MYTQKKLYIVICEGASEKAYIQKLNVFLNDNNYSFTFVPKMVGCGHYNSVCKTYRDFKKNNPEKNKKGKTEIYIWVDWDTYLRNDNGDMDKYSKKPKNIPDFLFSHNNFEDFLALHLDELILAKWHDTCSKKGHIGKPMHDLEYIPLVKEDLFPNYCKGEIPFEITDNILRILFENNKNKNTFCRCKFADVINDLMKK